PGFPEKHFSESADDFVQLRSLVRGSSAGIQGMDDGAAVRVQDQQFTIASLSTIDNQVLQSEATGDALKRFGMTPAKVFIKIRHESFFFEPLLPVGICACTEVLYPGVGYRHLTGEGTPIDQNDPVFSKLTFFTPVIDEWCNKEFGC